MAGWKAIGLFPFEPKKVLNDLPKPLAPLLLPIASEAMDICETEGTPHTPMTPVTLVTIEAVTSLYDIIKRDTLVVSSLGVSRDKIGIVLCTEMSVSE
jgi:hypothetical protein